LAAAAMSAAAVASLAAPQTRPGCWRWASPVVQTLALAALAFQPVCLIFDAESAGKRLRRLSAGLAALLPVSHLAAIAVLAALQLREEGDRAGESLQWFPAPGHADFYPFSAFATLSLAAFWLAFLYRFKRLSVKDKDKDNE